MCTFKKLLWASVAYTWPWKVKVFFGYVSVLVGYIWRWWNIRICIHKICLATVAHIQPYRSWFFVQIRWKKLKLQIHAQKIQKYVNYRLCWYKFLINLFIYINIYIHKIKKSIHIKDDIINLYRKKNNNYHTNHLAE